MDLIERIGNDLPVWLLAIVAFALSLAAAYWGERLHLRRETARGPDDPTPEGYIMSGVIGLLGLLLGFTFALAIDRYDARRLLVVDEAQAVRTAYLQALTFPDPSRSRLRSLLERYVNHRLTVATAADRQQRSRLLQVSTALQDRMWAETVAAVNANRDDVASTFMGSMSAVIEIDVARRTARQTHVPGRVFVILFIYMLMSAAVLGYVIGPKHRTAVVILLALTNMSYALIFDIDGATRGGVRESQLPMQELQALMRPAGR